MIRVVLDQGQAAAEVRVDLDMEHGASLVESAVFKTLVVWLMEGGSLDDVRAEMSGKLDIVFGGIAPRTKNKESRTSSRKKVRG